MEEVTLSARAGLCRLYAAAHLSVHVLLSLSFLSVSLSSVYLSSAYGWVALVRRSVTGLDEATTITLSPLHFPFPPLPLRVPLKKKRRFISHARLTIVYLLRLLFFLLFCS